MKGIGKILVLMLLLPFFAEAQNIDDSISICSDIDVYMKVEKMPAYPGGMRELMKDIKGPDFPTGAMILGREGIKEAYTTGKGKITVRAETEIEEMSGNRQRIIVRSLPYQVNKANLIIKIDELIKDRKVEGIPLSFLSFRLDFLPVRTLDLH